MQSQALVLQAFHSRASLSFFSQLSHVSTTRSVKAAAGRSSARHPKIPGPFFRPFIPDVCGCCVRWPRTHIEVGTSDVSILEAVWLELVRCWVEGSVTFLGHVLAGSGRVARCPKPKPVKFEPFQLTTVAPLPENVTAKIPHGESLLLTTG